MPYKYQDVWHQRMRAWKQDLIMRQRSEKTIEIYMVTVHRLWKWLGKPYSPSDVSLKTYQSFEHYLVLKGLKENTVATYMTYLKLYLQFAGYKEVNQIYTNARISAKEDRIFLTESQIEIIRNVAHTMGAKYELIYSLAVDNGLRRGDILNIKYKEALNVCRTRYTFITQKGNRRRQLIVHIKTMEPLNSYMEQRRESLKTHGLEEYQKYLFVSPTKGSRIGEETLSGWFNRLSRASGISFCPHDLRASFVRRHARAGTRPDVVMGLTGHSNWTTTFKFYYGKDLDAMRQAQDNI